MTAGPGSPRTIASTLPDRSAPVEAAARQQQGWAVLLMLASGASGLGCQFAWTQQASLWLGHELPAVLAVMAAFFTGLGLGAWALARRIAASARPERWYAGCEAVIALWGLVLVAAMQPLGQGLQQLVGPSPSAAWHWAVAFGGTGLLLLPATLAMGATLPALDAWLGARTAQRSPLGLLYAANTAGAVAGVLASVFWLLPTLGLRTTALVFAGISLYCAGLAWRRPVGPSAPHDPPAAAPGAAGAPAKGGPVAASARRAMPTAARASAATARRQALTLLACSGLLGIGFEVLVVRLLAQVSTNTVYTYALLLAVYLGGTAIGAAAWHAWHRNATPARLAEAPDLLARRLLAWLGISCVPGLAVLWKADALVQGLAHQLATAWGAGLAAQLVSEGVLALLAFGPATVCMGAVFSQLMLCARTAGIHTGHALAVNTLAAALAPLLFGVLLLPLLGAKASLLLVVAAYLALSRPWQPLSTPAWAAAGAVAMLALAAPPLRHVPMDEGDTLLAWVEGPMASVSVVQTPAGVRRLHIDGGPQEGDNASGLADRRQALLPLLLHPAPRSALLLGLGTGITAAAAAAEPTLAVQVVELLPEVVRAATWFDAAVGPQAPANLQVKAADARRHVQSSRQQHDVIVADNFQPARSGAAALYTVEHFQAVRSRLAPGGLFCQWLPLHQMDLATLASIVRSYQAVFPQSGAVLATLSLQTPVLGLVSHRDGERFAVEGMRARLAATATSLAPQDNGLPDVIALAGTWVAGPQALRQFSAAAPLNTDDHPVVAWQAPRLASPGAAGGAPALGPRDRLLALLGQWQLAPGELLEPAQAEPDWERRRQAYARARDAYLRAGRSVQPSRDVQRMLAQVGAPLLQVLRISPEFRPAYDPLLRMAEALQASDPVAARALLAALVAVQPARPEAQALLDGAPPR